jgi:para-nitrobenzyl esterase
MSNGVLVFRGIRFAKANRFRPPDPVPLLDTPAPGGSFGAPAPQNPDALDYMWGEVLAPGDEDCLTLNIWTPAADAARRPVMVYIHGGAFIIGSGRWGWYEGTRLVQREQVVLVTINYRLGAFGFLDLSGVGGPAFAESANCGLLDQIAALRWVKQNIERFGGNPDCVTVFGESAGGISISCLLACPQARGLFRRAICMSGPPSMVRSKEFAGRVTEKLMRFAGVDSAEKLATLPSATLLPAQDQTIRSADFLGELLYAPTIDGAVLPLPPLHAIRAGSAADVTLMTGTTLDEARLWSLYSPILRVLPVGALGRWFRSLGLDAGAIRAAYRQARPGLGLGKLAMAVVGDSLFWLPQIRLVEAQAKHRSDTRMYMTAWQTPVLGGRLGAPHAVDEPMMFGNLDASGVKYMIGDRPDQAAEREAFSRAMQRAWAAFARTGDPSHADLPDWPVYDAAKRATMILDRTCRVENDPLSPIRRAWDKLAFDGVHPPVEELPRIADIKRFFVLWALVMLFVLGLLTGMLILTSRWLA